MKTKYILKCQQSKKVFSDEEIESFKLKRRKETADVRFDIEKILGMQSKYDS